MKSTTSRATKSLAFVMLVIMMASSLGTVDAAPVKKDIFSALSEVETLIHDMLASFRPDAHSKFEETVMKDLISKNSTIMEHLLKAHIVGTDTTLYNIWNQMWFTNTIYNVYLTAFQSGL